MDLERGPGETVNMASDPRHPTLLRQHRHMLAVWRVAVKTRLPKSTAWNENHLCRKGDMIFCKKSLAGSCALEKGILREARFMSLLDGKCVLLG
ncbi:MAG: hypothetical protein ACYCO5_09270 [Acidobacteriaceae bacterium]